MQSDRMQDLGYDRIQSDRIEQDRMPLKDRMHHKIDNLLNNAVMTIANRSSTSKEEQEVFNKQLADVYKRVDTIVSSQYRLKYGSYNKSKGSFQDYNGNILTDFYEVGRIVIHACVDGQRVPWSYKLLSKHESSYNVPIKLRVYRVCELDYIFVHRVCSQPNNQEHSIYNDNGNLIVNEYNSERHTKDYINNFIDTYVKTE